MFVSEWLVWYYKHADSNSVKKSLKLTGINYSKNVNEQVALLCMVLYLIFFSNFVSNKIFTFDDRETPHGCLNISSQNFNAKMASTINI